MDAPEVDTAVPTQLARAARALAPAARCVVVQGLYRHVSFILEPAPIRVQVVEVVPPEPPKLLDQARRVLEVAEDLPPIELVPSLVDLTELAAGRRAPRYLLPCRGSGIHLDGAEVRFLDERPEKEPGCCSAATAPASSTAGSTGRRRKRSTSARGGWPPAPAPPGRCSPSAACSRRHIERDGTTVTVPWGASLDLVREGLQRVAATAEPAWSPA